MECHGQFVDGTLLWTKCYWFLCYIM